MKIAITGATGFIGKGLTQFLMACGHEVIALSRNPAKALEKFDNKVKSLEWAETTKEQLAHEFEGTDAFVNLAGENISSSLWTKKKRKRILESRIRSGRLITELVRRMKNPPRVLIQASAVGYYGTRLRDETNFVVQARGDELLTEKSGCGKGFLPEVAVEWEKSTMAVETSGVRRVVIRSGIVLSAHGGAFSTLALPYKLHIGIIPGSGEQWMPWIHYDDEINAVHFLITNAASSGIYNLVAPTPTRMKEVGSAIGPTHFKIPAVLLKLALGKMAVETILVSQRVVPERLLIEGFQFRFGNITEAVKNIYGGKK